MTNTPTPQQDAVDAKLRQVLIKVDTAKTKDNPDGNPFIPGNLSVDEAVAALRTLLIEAEIKALETVLAAEYSEHAPKVIADNGLKIKTVASYVIRDRIQALKDNNLNQSKEKELDV